MELVSPGKYAVSDRFAPTATERETLAARCGQLAIATAPAGFDEARRPIAMLFAVMPSRVDDEDYNDLITLYAKLMAPHPAYAIAKACRDVVEAGERFRPGAPELLARVKNAAQDARDERGTIDRLLTARVTRTAPDEERARIRAGFAELSARLEEANLPPGGSGHEESFDEKLARYVLSPAALSPLALATRAVARSFL